MPNGLTDRQQDVYRLLLTGMSDADIGELLGLKAHSVKVHVSQILSTTGFATRYELLGAQPEPPDAEKVVFATYLTKRTIHAGDLVASGKSYEEIATVLGKTKHSFKSNYMRRLLDISGMANRGEFIVWWKSHKIMARLELR